MNTTSSESSANNGTPTADPLIRDIGLTPTDASAVQSLLQSPSETVLGVLGQGWLGSLISGAGLTKAILVVTDQHLYLKGKMFVKVHLPNGGLRRQMVKRDLVVALEDVHSSEVREITSSFGVLLFCLVFLVVLVGIAMSVSADFGIVMVVVAVVFGLPVVFQLVNILIRGHQKELSVHYGANDVSVPVKWYTEEEVNLFRRHITRAASERRKGNRNTTVASAETIPVEGKVCPYCAETIKAQAIKCRYCGSDL